jgi:hypothetical protein
VPKLRMGEAISPLLYTLSLLLLLLLLLLLCILSLLWYGISATDQPLLCFVSAGDNLMFNFNCLYLYIFPLDWPAFRLPSLSLAHFHAG